MGILILTEAKERAEEIRKFAEKSDNWYRLGRSKFVPGDRAEYILKSGTYRAVFTWTMTLDGKVYRHLSLSAFQEGKFPQPMVVWTLAHYFGFTGAKLSDAGDVATDGGTDWGMGMDREEGTIMVQQEVPSFDPRIVAVEGVS